MVGNFLCYFSAIHHYDRFPPGGNMTDGNMLGNHYRHYLHYLHQHDDPDNHHDDDDTMMIMK